jgi:hypothetical protein
MRRLALALCLLGFLATAAAAGWTIEVTGVGAAAVEGGDASGADDPATPPG